MKDQHVLITGGAGYIGSYLTGVLLRSGCKVTVVDDLLYGGESLLSYFNHPNFHFFKGDVWESRTIRSSIKNGWKSPDAVIHLAAIAGFPACQSVGRQVAWRYNVETTERVFEQAEKLNVKRFLYVSTYSNYGLSPKGKSVDENTMLNPQSLYAETKVASERFLLGNSDSATAPVILRVATLYGNSPRPRFDLIVNQFVHDAYTRRELMIYQRGYSRSFVHISDAVQGIILTLEAPIGKVQGEVYNVGVESGNLTKNEVVTLILKRLPETNVIYKDLTFGGDMRDITVSFSKIQKELGFLTKYSVDDGIREVLNALRFQIIKNPGDLRYRNARFIVQ